jgi:O-antigen ligase
MVAASVFSLAVGAGAVYLPVLPALLLAGIFVAFVFRVFSSIPLVILILCSAVGLPAAIQVGPASGLGVLTIAYAATILLVIIASKPSHFPVPTIALPYVVFLAWAFATTIANLRLNVEAIQNLLVLSIPALMIALLCSESREANIPPDLLQKAWVVASFSSIGFYLLHDYTVLMSLVGEPAARSFALFAVFCVAWHASSWRYGSRTSLVVCLIVVLGIGASLSRTALIVAILLIALSRFDPTKARGWLSLTAWIVVGSAGVYWATTSIAPLRERFLEGDTSLQVGGLKINAMGRTWMWERTLDSYRQAPWIGQGSGSAQELMRSLSSNISHPHNDYLRILHDFGNVGLGLWAVGMACLLGHSVRSWLTTANAQDAMVHLAGTLSIVGLCISMLTDNPIVYVYCMVPLGLTVGTSISRQRAASSVPIGRKASFARAVDSSSDPAVTPSPT